MRKEMFPGMERLMIPWVGKTMKHIDLYICSRLADHGIQLTRQQVLLMKILHHDGPLPQHGLAFLTDRDKTSLTRLLSGMEKKNLVARITSESDKRVNMVHLTRNGENVLSETIPVLMTIIQELQEGVSEKEQQAVIRVMKKIQGNISRSK